MAIESSSVTDTYQQMQQLLGKVMPDFEIKAKAEIVYEINRLKKERGAIILGHNYMEPALYHTIPDITGDSLWLSAKAAETTCDPIIFCGVRFMAETAKILSPEKTVLLPARVAGCSLAASITADDVRKLKQQFPGVPVVTYINTYADVKAEVDICCTSSNAVKVVRSLNADRIIFLPDEYLAKNVAEETGMKVIVPTAEGVKEFTRETGKVMVAWHGRCEVHEQFTVDDINNARQQFPDVVVVSHPECSPEVVHASDFAGSTTKIVEYVKSSPGKRFLVLTECSMGDNIMAEAPEKEMLRMCSIRCPHMNEITLEDTLNSLRNNVQEIDVPEPVRTQARKSLERMLAVRA